MNPDAVEQALYEHAIRSKARPPMAERMLNLFNSRIFAGGIVAGAALVCSLALTQANAGSDTGSGSITHPVMSDTNRNHDQLTAPRTPYFQNSEPVTASLAMSHVGS